MKGFIHSFESFGTKDGPGIRFVVFLQGCPLKCLYCHNVDTWDMKNNKCYLSPEEVIKEISKVKGFVKGGVTFSGGEPLLQTDFLIETMKLCKEQNIHIALDTSGFILNEKVKEAINLSDLIMLDIKQIDSVKYKKLTSGELQTVLNFMEYLSKIKKTVWLRYVLVPGYTDDEKDLENWAKYVSKFSNVERVDILPFHQMAKYKWNNVGLEYELKYVEIPTQKQIEKAENVFKQCGLKVFI